MSDDPAEPAQESDAVIGGDVEPGGKADGRGRQLLLEAAVLVALAEHESAHGYDLRRLLPELTSGFMQVDSANLYRLLRRLESDGLVTSAWTEGEHGPQRRQYRLTSLGCQHLASLRKPLEARAQAFSEVIEAIDRFGSALPPSPGA